MGMSDAIVASLTLAGVMGYGLFAGVTWALLPESMRRLPEGEAIAAVMFWPLALPGILGARLVRRLQRPTLPKMTARSSR